MSITSLGRFTVRTALRSDNPAFPVYLVFLGDVLIGKSFSMPDLGCCEWLEQQRKDEKMYACSSAKLMVRTTGEMRKKRWDKQRGVVADMAAIAIGESEEEQPA